MEQEFRGVSHKCEDLKDINIFLPLYENEANFSLNAYFLLIIR